MSTLILGVECGGVSQVPVGPSKQVGPQTVPEGGGTIDFLRGVSLSRKQKEVVKKRNQTQTEPF